MTVPLSVLLIEDNPGDAVLLDLSLPDSEGLDTLQTVLSHAPQIPVIVMTGQTDEETAMQAVQSGKLFDPQAVEMLFKMIG